MTATLQPAKREAAGLGAEASDVSRATAEQRKYAWIAALALASIVVHLVLRYLVHAPAWLIDLPLLVTLALGGAPLVFDLLKRVRAGEFGSDLLAGMSITVSVLLGQYLAGALVVLMLAGGNFLESYAIRSASSVLAALAKRAPTLAHRQQGADLIDVPLTEIGVGDELLVLPHEVCPVDAEVTAGHGVMDESYLTGEPFLMSKTPGSQVFSGAINGDFALTIRATRLASDSRFARIMQVMHDTEQRRPRLRRLGDQLGAFYTPLAVLVALAGWGVSHDPNRFLAVLVVATPCPLLIAIPVAIIGSISLSARRGIIVKDPAVLEQVDRCRTMILDKTGTLTYGKPRLVMQHVAPALDRQEMLGLAASLERYSKHPLATAVLEAAEREGCSLLTTTDVSERPGEGMRGQVAGRDVWITSRKQIIRSDPAAESLLPPRTDGLECCLAIDGRYAATYAFRDEPRADGASFVAHLKPKHAIQRVMLVSGDRESEVRYLANLVGIREIHASQSPEDKVRIVRAETAVAKTLFVGDGINDAPALASATVGLAFGRNSDVTAEAAGAVIMDSSLARVDEFLHIGRRMRNIALQSALGGMALSIVGMGFAVAGWLPPVAGAIAQEVIDLVAVLNALRVTVPVNQLTDFER